MSFSTEPSIEDFLHRLVALEQRNTTVTQQNQAIQKRVGTLERQTSVQTRYIFRLERRLESLQTELGIPKGGWEEAWVEREGVGTLLRKAEADGREWTWSSERSKTGGSKPRTILAFSTEILARIVHFSSTSDLASLCRVSFGMLSLAGPALYRHHIVIDGVKALSRLFVPRPRSSFGSRLSEPLSVQYLTHLTLHVPAKATTLPFHSGRLEPTLEHPPFLFHLKVLYLLVDSNSRSLPKSYLEFLPLLGPKVLVVKRKITTNVDAPQDVFTEIVVPWTVRAIFPEVETIVNWGACLVSSKTLAMEKNPEEEEEEADAVYSNEDPSDPHFRRSLRTIFVIDKEALSSRILSSLSMDLVDSLVNTRSVFILEDDQEAVRVAKDRLVAEIWVDLEDPRNFLEKQLKLGLNQCGIEDGFRVVEWKDVKKDVESKRIFKVACGNFA